MKTSANIQTKTTKISVPLHTIIMNMAIEEQRNFQVVLDRLLKQSLITTGKISEAELKILETESKVSL